MNQTGKPSMPDNAEDTIKCPVCGAMINAAGAAGAFTCPVCGKKLDPERGRVFGASNEGF